MKQYRVKALSFHSDKTQKVYNAGDILPADILHDGVADKAVADGFLEEYHGKKGEHADSEGTPHVVTAADVERNPGAGLKEGETIYLPFDGFVLDDAENQAQNESNADHDAGKVLVPADEAKNPATAPVEEPAKVEPPKEVTAKIILPGGEKVDESANKNNGGKKK